MASFSHINMSPWTTLSLRRTHENMIPVLLGSVVLLGDCHTFCLLGCCSYSSFLGRCDQQSVRSMPTAPSDLQILMPGTLFALYKLVCSPFNHTSTSNTLDIVMHSLDNRHVFKPHLPPMSSHPRSPSTPWVLIGSAATQKKTSCDRPS